MLINGYPPVNTAPVLDFYNRKGLDISKLERANSQEFRYIKGAGEGFFLLTQSITSEFLTLAVDNRTTTVKVLDRLSLEHPSKTGTILYLYHTAELKYKLYTAKVERNYNVTIRKSLTLYGVPAVLCLPPELEAPKTLEEVIDNFLPSGYTLEYDGPEIISYDIAIDGLSVLDAIDHLCSIYGLVWTATATTVYIFDMDLEDGSSEIITGFADPIKDINHTQLNANLAVVNVSFPVYDWVRTTPAEYITVDDISAVPGQAVNVQDPYFPAVLNPVGSVRNNSALNTRAGLIADNLEAIASSINFIEYNYYNIRPLGQHPLSLSEIVGDIGAGPFTIYRTLAYPYMPVKQQVAQDRLANNWIGAIADGYYGPVPTFIVIPIIPIDGALPPGPQVVVNKYRWNYGEPEWRVRVEWSPFEGVWNALQQEYDCPPEEAPPPPAEPTEPTDPWYGPEGPPSLPFPD